MRICLAQANPKVGDVQGNLAILQQIVEENNGVDLIVFPELFLTGYPPKDLLFRGDFQREIQAGIQKLLRFTENYPETVLLVGLPWQENGSLFNSVIGVSAGQILGMQHKRKLTHFSLFNEHDYFTAGAEHALIQLDTEVVGLALGLELDANLAKELKKQGATLIINPSAVPFEAKNHQEHLEGLRSLAVQANVPLIRVNQVGGNDELIFAGDSFLVDSTGNFSGLAKEFVSGTSLVDLTALEYAEKPEADETEQIYQALVLGLRDYLRKNGMQRVIIGLSGGLDSAVAAVIATEAIGAENVWGVTQPGPYSPPSSEGDARALAENLGIKFDVITINDLYEATLATLATHFEGMQMNVAEENIQARLRGNLLMALSNKFGGLVLTNSNKSELAVGYCTLYGDMSGGIAVIADVYKTMVYQLAYYINRQEEIIPWNTIEKPPSAELRPNQRDDESLPPYDVLDAVIDLYLHRKLAPGEIVEAGYKQEMVEWICKTIDNNEYKRRQAALILRVTTPILGVERQMPLTAQKRFDL